MGKTKVGIVKSKPVKMKKSKKVHKTVTQISRKTEEEAEELPKKSLVFVGNSNSESKLKKGISSDKSNKSKKDPKNHKAELENLKEIDPEFYKFLEDNDKELLEFNLFDTDDDEEDADEKDKEEDDDDDDDEKFHKPTDNLEVASDESDFEVSGDEDDAESNVITLKLLRSWQANLQEKHVSIDVIRKVIQAFSSALASITEEEGTAGVYKVQGSTSFNGVVQLCVLHLPPAIYKFLGISPKSKKPLHKCNKWKKLQSALRSYLLDLSRLFEHVSSSNILAVLLKHLHQISSMIGSFPTIAKPVMKRLILLWSTAEETVRVLSFLCILKITRTQQISFLNHILKAMYLSYVRNSKFVSPNTLPGINFMRRSLVEMFALDLNVSYQHAFLYIRQLAIHLRNAIVLKKKESFQAVYNWQYINSIRLWVELLGATYNKPQLQPLLYPLVSIITGVVKLIPTAQFFPLRFHCIQALIQLCKETNVFIPVLPFILEVLNSNTFNKKHSVVSMKPMSFACILRLNKPQMAENGFRDEVVEQVCALILEYLAIESYSLAFPDLVVPTVIALKQYLKTCKVSNYTRKLKQILDKILENSKFIEEKRRRINFDLKDTSQIQAWETTLTGAPLDLYYQSWVKTHETRKKRLAANTDDINDYDIPIMQKRKLTRNKLNEDEDMELFPSDSEDENLQLENPDPQPQKQQKKLKKKVKETVSGQKEVQQEEDDFENNAVDIVKDLDLDDW